jgi:tRNA A-37 threonylcarbamoyl transferase component Bud32
LKKISHEKYLALHNGAEILASDSFGEKVLRLKDGSIIKLFRTKRIISSSFFYPYALRFVNNAAKLTARGIRTVKVIDAFKIPSIKRTAVHYQELEGEILRNHIAHNLMNEGITRKLAAFVAKLHNEGIYFRSLHSGNIMIAPDNSFGLIDIADMKIKAHPLSIRMRIRNFIHLTRYEIDRNFLNRQKDLFIGEYLKICRLSDNNTKKLQDKLKELL